MESILAEMEKRMQKIITSHFEAAHEMLDRIQPRQPRGEPNMRRRDHLSTATIFDEIKPALTLPKSRNHAFRPENHQPTKPGRTYGRVSQPQSKKSSEAKDEQVAATSSLSSQPKAEEQKQEENYLDQLTLESNNEEATKNSMVLNKFGSMDYSTKAFSERYPLISTPESYMLEFKSVGEVDFVFGDFAFSKPENKVKSLLAEFVKPKREEQLVYFWPSNTEPVSEFKEEKHSDYKLFTGKEFVAKTEALRRAPMMDKVRNGQRVIESASLDDYGISATSKEGNFFLYLKDLSHPFDPGNYRGDLDLRTNPF